MPCPFAVTGYMCDINERCKTKCYKCINKLHMPIQSTNERKYNYRTSIIREHEKESRWKQPNRRVNASTQYFGPNEGVVEYRCHGVTCTKNRPDRSSFSGNYKTSEMPTTTLDMASNRKCSNICSQTNSKSFSSEIQEYTSQDKDTKILNDPKNPSNTSISYCQHCSGNLGNKFSTENKLNELKLGTVAKNEATRKKITKPFRSRTQKKVECDAHCYNKNVLLDIQSKINDMNLQYDWTMKQNEDFVEYLWRLCKAKNLQSNQTNLAKEDPFNERCTQTDFYKCSIDNGAVAGNCIDCKYQNTEINSTTPIEASNAKYYENDIKSKVDEFQCRTPSSRLKHQSVACGQEAHISAIDVSENVGMLYYNLNCCQANLPDNMCRPLLLCSTPFVFKPCMPPSKYQNGNASQPNKESEDNPVSSIVPITTENSKLYGMNDNAEIQEKSTKVLKDTSVSSKKKTTTNKSTAEKNEESEMGKKTTKVTKGNKVSSKKKSASKKPTEKKRKTAGGDEKSEIKENPLKEPKRIKISPIKEIISIESNSNIFTKNSTKQNMKPLASDKKKSGSKIEKKKVRTHKISKVSFKKKPTSRKHTEEKNQTTEMDEKSEMETKLELALKPKSLDSIAAPYGLRITDKMEEKTKNIKTSNNQSIKSKRAKQKEISKKNKHSKKTKSCNDDKNVASKILHGEHSEESRDSKLANKRNSKKSDASLSKDSLGPKLKQLQKAQQDIPVINNLTEDPQIANINPNGHMEPNVLENNDDANLLNILEEPQMAIIPECSPQSESSLTPKLKANEFASETLKEELQANFRSENENALNGSAGRNQLEENSTVNDAMSIELKNSQISVTDQNNDLNNEYEKTKIYPQVSQYSLSLVPESSEPAKSVKESKANTNTESNYRKRDSKARPNNYSHDFPNIDPKFNTTKKKNNLVRCASVLQRSDLILIMPNLNLQNNSSKNSEHHNHESMMISTSFEDYNDSDTKVKKISKNISTKDNIDIAENKSTQIKQDAKPMKETIDELPNVKNTSNPPSNSNVKHDGNIIESDSGEIIKCAEGINRFGPIESYQSSVDTSFKNGISDLDKVGNSTITHNGTLSNMIKNHLNNKKLSGISDALNGNTLKTNRRRVSQDLYEF